MNAKLSNPLPYRKTLLKWMHNDSRIMFACVHSWVPNNFWNNILWLDEMKIEFLEHNSSCRVWKKIDTAMNQKHYTHKNAYRLKCCGCLFFSGTAILHVIEGNIDGSMHRRAICSFWCNSLNEKTLSIRYPRSIHFRSVSVMWWSFRIKFIRWTTDNTMIWRLFVRECREYFKRMFGKWHKWLRKMSPSRNCQLRLLHYKLKFELNVFHR